MAVKRATRGCANPEGAVIPPSINIQEAMNSCAAMSSDYRLEDRIGQGGMGAIYRSYDKGLHRTVAIQASIPEGFAGGERKRRLLREARAASSLNHPNIVTIYAI